MGMYGMSHGIFIFASGMYNPFIHTGPGIFLLSKVR